MQTRNGVFSGLLWSFAERFGAQIVSFIVSIVLARLLLPSDYGIIAMVTVFINIANSFVTGGFGNALIQKKDADDIDFSTIFYFNIFFSICVYLIIFFIAPFLEIFYHQKGLALVTRVLGLRLLLVGVNSIQRAFVARKMEFRFFFFATLGGTLLSAVVGIVLAYKGFGVWALVAQYLTNTTTDTLVLWFTVKWRPKWMFSYERLKSLVSYGWKLLCSSLLSTVYSEMNSLVIGKFYSSSDLAFYNKGKQFPSVIVVNINSAIETVLFPSMSKDQDSVDILRYKTKKSMQMSTFFVFPLVFGMAGAANSIILALLTEKWMDSAIYVMIACASFALVPIGMANLQAIKAVGRSDIYLKLDVIKKIIGICGLLLALPHGVACIAIAEAISNIIGFLINLLPNRKILHYGFMEQLIDVAPAFFISLIMAVAVYFVGILDLPVWPKLFMQFIIGVIIYFVLAFVFKVEALTDARSIVKNIRIKKNN